MGGKLMKEWKIVADSLCDIRKIDNLDEHVDFESVPLIINVDDETFIDDENIDLVALRQALKNSKVSTSSACPGPSHYAEAYKGAKNVIVFCVSKNLSGSYNSAVLGKEIALEENPDVNIHIINTATAGAEINIIVQRAVDLANKGVSFEEMTQDIDSYNNKTSVLFILESIDNLVKAGRVSKLLGQMVGLLNIFLIGKRTPEGTIELAKKARGSKRALKTLIDELKEHKFNGQRMEIAHANNPNYAENIRKAIIEKYPMVNITIAEMGGLTEYYAEEKGIIVGFETN